MSVVNIKLLKKSSVNIHNLHRFKGRYIKKYIVTKFLKHLLRCLEPMLKEDDDDFANTIKNELNDDVNREFIKRYLRMLQYHGAYQRYIDILKYMDEEKYKLEIKSLEKNLNKA